MNVFTIADSDHTVRTFEGLRILPDSNYVRDQLPEIHIFVVPSAGHHLDSDLENMAMIDFVRRTAASAMYSISLCDGAFVLATAGVLDTVASTTFPGDITLYHERFPTLDIRDSVSFVHQGKYIASAGGAKSFDAALYLTELMYGGDVAHRIAEGLVIEWDLSQVQHLVVDK